MNRKERVISILDNILHWKWTEGLLYWIVYSAGTFSGLAFLIASIWMSMNAADHEFVRMFLSEKQTLNCSYWAMSAYVILPVCILPLAAITTYRHVRTWIYLGEWVCSSTLWCLLYGLPTLMFLIIDICIIGNSNNVHYTLPSPLVTGRSIMAYSYGLTAIIYHYVGKKQEVDRLNEKDVFIDQLEEKVRLLIQEKEEIIAKGQEQIAILRLEVAKAKAAWETEQKQKANLQKEINIAHESALEAYGEEVKNLLTGDDKTVSIESIMQLTGHPRRTITNAIRGRKLAVSSRNKELVLISSLSEWLKETPPSAPQLRIVNE